MALWGFRDVFPSKLGSDLEPASMLEHFSLLLFLNFFTIQSVFGLFEGKKVNQALPTPLPSSQAFPAVSEPLPGLARGGWVDTRVAAGPPHTAVTSFLSGSVMH